MSSVEMIVEEFLQARSSSLGPETLSTWRLALCDTLRLGYTTWPQFETQQASTALLTSMWTLHQKSLTPKQDIEKLHIADLTLAQCCFLSMPDAIAHFVHIHTPNVQFALARLNIQSHSADDLKQEIFAKLLTVSPRKIGSYTGRAELRSWLKTIATRDGISFLRERGATATDDNVLHAIQDRDLEHPAHNIIAVHYAAEFKQAFESAMTALSNEQRSLLRQFYVDSLSLDQIGLMLGVHKATVFRRLQAARGALAGAVTMAFQAAIPANTAELHSIVRGLQSQVTLSLSRLTRHNPA
jgi:RNA polymerase sigma-70 factor, ECF subfamily